MNRKGFQRGEAYFPAAMKRLPAPRIDCRREVDSLGRLQVAHLINHYAGFNPLSVPDPELKRSVSTPACWSIDVKRLHSGAWLTPI